MGIKILHTADWHLGKRLDSFSRMEEQLSVLEEMIQIADEEEVDLVLIAGDLFDAFNPPVEAIELFYKTLKRLSREGKRPVLAIAGNHDSPDRIDAADPLAKACGIIFIGYPQAVIGESELLDGFKISKTAPGFLEILLPQFSFPIRVLHTAYANEVRLKQFLGTEDKARALQEVLQAHWNRLASEYCDTQGVNVLMTHLFMMQRNGARLEEPDGEKSIQVGNADVVYSDAIPTPIQYTALGHLHRHHQIGELARPAVYSGSPLCYSFSEAGQEKYVMLVELLPDTEAVYTKRILQAGRTLFRKTFDDIEVALGWLEENPYALVELTLVSDTFLSTDDLKRLQGAHDGIVHIIPKVKREGNPEAGFKTVDLNQDMGSLFSDYFKSRYQQDPNPELMALFEELKSL